MFRRRRATCLVTFLPPISEPQIKMFTSRAWAGQSTLPSAYLRRSTTSPCPRPSRACGPCWRYPARPLIGRRKIRFRTVGDPNLKGQRLFAGGEDARGVCFHAWIRAEQYGSLRHKVDGYAAWDNVTVTPPKVSCTVAAFRPAVTTLLVDVLRRAVRHACGREGDGSRLVLHAPTKQCKAKWIQETRGAER